MSKRAGQSARWRALVTGAVVVLGALVAVPAFAIAPAPTAEVVADGVKADNYINQAEWASGITVTGTYDASASPAVDTISVRLLNSPTCDPNAPETTALKFAPGPDATFGGGTWSITFTAVDLPGVATPSDPSDDVFSEGAEICARVRASDNGGTTYGDYANSSNAPIKDTVAPAVGTAALLDPNDDGYMNQVEADGGLIGLQWTGASDAASATLRITDPSNVSACTDQTDQPASGTSALDPTCAAAIPQPSAPFGDTFNFRVQWFDAAGNESAAANCVTGEGCDSLVKDVVAPGAPTVSIDSDPITETNQGAVIVCGDAEDNATVQLQVTSGGQSVFGTTKANLIAPSCSIAADYRATVDVTTLPDNNTADSDPTNDATTATVYAVDAAGNVGPSATDTAFKDANPPATPAVQITPQLITALNQTSVEVSVGGESGTQATVTLSDHTGTGSLTQTFAIASDVTSAPFNVTNLADGPITATVVLVDSVGNVSPPGIATAFKNVYAPLVKILSPARNSMNKGEVTITGTADTIVSSGGLGEVEVYEGNNLLGKAKVNTSGTWSLKLTFEKSATHIIRARATKAGSGAPLGFKPGGVLPPSEFTDEHRFDVDAVRPATVATTATASLYRSGDAVVIEGNATDDFSGLLAVEYHVYDLKGAPDLRDPQNPVIGRVVNPFPSNADCTGCGPWNRRASWKIDLSTLPSGQYYVQIFGIDVAGNRQADPTIVTFVKL